MTDLPRAILYSKPGCHLCEDVEQALAQLRARYPHALEVVDISQDPALLERYGVRIPVLSIGGREYDAPLPREVLERALVEAPVSRPLKLANLALGATLVGAAVPPILSRLGLHGPAGALYRAYRPACHQTAARSLFLFGRERVYSSRELRLLGADSPRFVGNAVAGWKLALCQRDLGLVAGLLAFGLFYAAGRPRWQVVPSSYSTFALLAAPLAVDGLSQLGGQRESTWFLRLGTGLLFGLAAAWLVVPRLDREPPVPTSRTR